MPIVLPMHLVLLVAGAVMGAIILFGLVVGCGTLAVRWLRLPNDPPEEAAYEPSAPELVPAGDPAAARARAATWKAQLELGRRARAVLHLARLADDMATWIATERPAAAANARVAATVASTASEQARSAFAANDPVALAAAELVVSTVRSQLDGLADGLPDPAIAERRKLLILSAALVGSLALAAVAMWLR